MREYRELKKFLLCLLPLSLLCAGFEATEDGSLMEAHAQTNHAKSNAPEPLAWGIGQQENQTLGRFCMASLYESVPNNQAANGRNFDVRMGIFLSTENILQIRLPVRPSEPLYNRLEGSDWIVLNEDNSSFDQIGAYVEEQPQTQPPNKLFSITPVKFNCPDGGQLMFLPGCEVELPVNDLLTKLSRADEIQVNFLTQAGLKTQIISTPRSDEMMNSLQKCVTALSNNQTYQDLIKLKDQDNAGN